MAGINDDTTTSWRPLGAELAFVNEYTRSEKRAEEVLLDGLAKGLIHWRCAELRVDEKRDFQANPPLETPLAAANLFFWRRDKHSHIDVDWRVDRQTSCVLRVGPVVRLGSDGMGNNFPIFDSRAPSNWTALRVCFHHGDVVDMLVTLGLMPRPPASLASSLPSQEPTPIALAVQTALATEPKEPRPTEPQPEKSQAEERGPLPQLSKEPDPEQPKKQAKAARSWLVQRLINDPPKANRAKWARDAYDKMQKDFEDIPWSDWRTLRRRMNDKGIRKEVEKKSGKKI